VVEHLPSKLEALSSNPSAAKKKKMLYIREKYTFNWEPVAHVCNPSYSGGRDQEDCGLKSAQANSSRRPYLEKTHHKKGLVKLAQSVGPEFKLQYLKKKKLCPDCSLSQ
jgi:hypothetical protein